jgi:hypothetical protein
MSASHLSQHRAAAQCSVAEDEPRLHVAAKDAPSQDERVYSIRAIWTTESRGGAVQVLSAAIQPPYSLLKMSHVVLNLSRGGAVQRPVIARDVLDMRYSALPMIVGNPIMHRYGTAQGC